MPKKVFLKEYQIGLLKEYNSPDNIYLADETKLNWLDDDAICFILDEKYGFHCDASTSHFEMYPDMAAQALDFDDNLSFCIYINKLKQSGDNKRADELIHQRKDIIDEIERYSIKGRYWVNHNVIAFWWNLPSSQYFYTIINELSAYAPINIDTLLIAYDEYIISAIDYIENGEIITFDEKKEQEAKALHLMNASDKVQTSQMQDYLHNRSENIGKKLQYSNSQDEMPMAQWRALHTTSESVENDKFIIGDEGDGSLGYSHIDEAFGHGKSVDTESINRIEYFVKSEIDDEDSEIINFYDIECYDIEGNRIFADNYLTFDDLWDILGFDLAQIISNDKDYKEGELNTIDDIIYTRSNGMNETNVDEVNKWAKKLFPTSQEYTSGDRGYILTDGTILEFGDYEDHMAISRVGHQTIGSFLTLGNIRINKDSFELACEPTFKQRKQLRQLIGHSKEVYVDIIKYDGNGMYGTILTSAKYVNPTFNKVIGEIDRYFSEGIKLRGGYYEDEYDDIDESFDKLNQNLLSCKGDETIHEEFRYETKDELSNIIKLYHGTNIDALNDILNDGVISSQKSSKRSETKGVNWFSTDPNHKWGMCLFSIEVPKEYFEFKKKPHFTLMNDVHVRTLDDIDIKQFNFSIEKIGAFDLESLGRLLVNSKNDIYIFQQNLMKTFEDRTSAFDFIDTPLMLQILKQLKGEDFIRREGLIENVQYEVEQDEVDLSSFKKADTLNPQIWGKNGLINSKVRLQLLDIADDFYDSLEVSFVKPSDIILTGSICNYNWSNESDIDLHIVIDFKAISENNALIQDYFNTKKNEWNQNHKNLQIYGFNVELYVEDENASKVSNGVYSLEKNKWIKKPDLEEVQDIEPISDDLKLLSSKLMTFIDDLKMEFHNTSNVQDIESIKDTLDYLWNFVKLMRKESLNKEGEYSKGNIIYKILRRNGYLDKIFTLSNDIYDKINSIS